MSNIYLICDDTPINNVILKKILTRVDPDCTVLESTGGTDCVDTFVSMMESNYIPTAIFLDKEMPRMDGISVAEVIRQPLRDSIRDHRYNGPIFLITALDNIQPFKKMKNLFTEVYQKPITMELIKEIMDVIEKHNKV